MNEHIGAAVVLDDKAEALLGVEKLDSALSHNGLLETRKGVRWPRTTIVRADIGFACSWGRLLRPIARQAIANEFYVMHPAEIATAGRNGRASLCAVVVRHRGPMSPID